MMNNQCLCIDCSIQFRLLLIHDKNAESLATAFIEEAIIPEDTTIPLVENPPDYSIYGAEYIEEGAKKQMNTDRKLPVTAAGALMPDAYQGYGVRRTAGQPQI